jgi:hypothetical protein
MTETNDPITEMVVNSLIASPAPGSDALVGNASNAVGQTQAEVLIFNPAGYHNNVAGPLSIVVT